MTSNDQRRLKLNRYQPGGPESLLGTASWKIGLFPFAVVVLVFFWALSVWAILLGKR